MWERDLYFGRDAAITPVLNALYATMNVIPKQPRNLRGTAKGRDECPIRVIDFVRIHTPH